MHHHLVLFLSYSFCVVFCDTPLDCRFFVFLVAFRVYFDGNSAFLRVFVRVLRVSCACLLVNPARE